MAFCVVAVACEKVDVPSEEDGSVENELVSLQDVAIMLSGVELGADRVTEVHDAVLSSFSNGYDEEYMLSDLLTDPGSGVGKERLKGSLRGDSSPMSYGRPLRDLFTNWCDSLARQGTKSVPRTKAGISAQDYLDYLQQSDMQIYWPDCDRWDGIRMPVITFAPEDGSATSNVGYYLDDNGNIVETLVDEQMVQNRPVWVINRNDDSSFTTLDIMKKNEPDWKEGGRIVVTPSSGKFGSSGYGSGTKATSSSSGRMLVLKSFKMLRQYDGWLRGASEFFVKMGAIDSFSASTEAELKLYDPQITDFMVVVRRRELGEEKQLGAILVTDWTDQLDDSAFMVIEDDGGTQTSWKCSGTVKIASKSYGFDVTLPLRSYDDIVWRGKLSRKYLTSAESVTGRFGDTEICFATEEY